MTVAVPACIRFPNCRTVQGEGPACFTGNVFILLCRLWMMLPWHASGCMGQGSRCLAGLAGIVLLWAWPWQGSMPGEAVIS